MNDRPPANLAHPVIELIRARLAAGSRPGHREDPHHLVLAIEGGASRAAFAGGMALAVDELGLVPCFDAVYGVSAGAWIGVWLLSGQAQAGLDTSRWSARTMLAVSNPARVLSGRPIVDSERALRVYQRFAPDVFATLLTHPVRLHPLATSVHTGHPMDLAPYIHDERTLRLALRATIALPAITGAPIALGGSAWLDGGFAENVPYGTPIRNGATHLLVLRNRPERERPPRAAGLEYHLIRGYLRRRAPAVLPVWQRQRQLSVTADPDHRRQVPVLHLRPPAGSPDVSLMQRRLLLLRQAVAIGRSTAHTGLSAVTHASTGEVIMP